MKTVIYHSADFDGIFCREIAKKFIGPGNADDPNQYIGWNFGDPKIAVELRPDRFVYVTHDGEFLGRADQIYILDLSPECLQFPASDEWLPERLVWIDHHKTSIAKWNPDIPGYRIDGVAACRLAWQWFSWIEEDRTLGNMPDKQRFVDRKVEEPLAVRLVGEYDVWDHRGDGDLEFQFGLRSVTLQDEQWTTLLSDDQEAALGLVKIGLYSKQYAKNVDAGVMKASFLVQWEGLTFLCLNGRGNSNTFDSRDVPETGHDANLMFYFQGRQWIVSLYHAKHRKDLDLSAIAVKHGGGGHKGACGFQCDSLPFLPIPAPL